MQKTSISVYLHTAWFKANCYQYNLDINLCVNRCLLIFDLVNFVGQDFHEIRQGHGHSRFDYPAADFSFCCRRHHQSLAHHFDVQYRIAVGTVEQIKQGKSESETSESKQLRRTQQREPMEHCTHTE